MSRTCGFQAPWVRRWAALSLTVSSFGTVDVSGQPRDATPMRLTLSQAVGMALEVSPAARDAADAVKQAEVSERVALSFWKPRFTPLLQVGLGNRTLAGQRYRVELAQELPTGTRLSASAGTTSARNQLGTYFFGETSFLIEQPLFSGFGADLRSSVARARAATARARMQQTAAAHEVAVEVAAVYFDVLVQQSSVETADRTTQRARNLLQSAEARLRAGRVSQLDVLRAHQLVTVAEAESLRASIALENALDLLRMHTAIPDNAPVQVAMPRLPTSTDAPSSPDALVMSRADVRAAGMLLADAEATLATAARRSRPGLNLQVALTRQSVGDSLSASLSAGTYHLSSMATLMFSPNRAETAAALDGASLEVLRRRRELESVIRSASADVRQATRERTRASAALELALLSSSLTAQEVEVALARHEHGLATMLDVVHAESNDMSSRSAIVAARAALALSYLRWRIATGTLDIQRDFAESRD